MQHTDWLISYDGDNSGRVRYQAAHLARSIILAVPSVSLLGRLIATADDAAAEGIAGTSEERGRDE
ncbi:hypothetical protein LG943_08600 [Streptomonospora sp. S1-112]|uniref:Uncharacterized protein n=1 Tax=Streptomonospora mangrovi TaxID=2883123 RepID=A0A9X3NJY7_9ACTN|nr:hypothetical protein [Streptomonospora mangrovi]MDA0564385.1 hypothetical protein [Streptomonospora mangrovi]